uniref:NADAR domain-containing protein n=1 Tax=viral metagenome TaxID=1070528 RepID=A0A6C0J7Z2_9ZZZZ
MMHQKAILFDDHYVADKILSECNPRDIKRLGREVHNFNALTWDKNKEDIVYRNNVAKFTQNIHLKKKLLDTYPKMLVEAAPLDRIWGIGYNEYNAKKVHVSRWGENLLGKTLIRVTDELK